MTHPRFELALDAFGPLPAGDILVIGPQAETDLRALPRERLVLVQGFAPDYAALKAQGYQVLPEIPEGEFAMAVVVLPRSKTQARDWLAQARARTSGPIWVDGQKTDGVDSILKDLKARGAVSPAISKAHGKIFVAQPEDLADWAGVASSVEGFVTRPGVFSEGRVDAGSQLLAQVLPAKLPARVADLGAGWGWLSAQILARRGVEELHLVEADHLALGCARETITDPRARFHWADATQFAPEARFGAVIMNPPFHAGRAADPSLGAAFIRAAANMLSLSGGLYMVANRHLPYEPVLRACFIEVSELGSDPAFKLFHAAKPRIGR